MYDSSDFAILTAAVFMNYVIAFWSFSNFYAVCGLYMYVMMFSVYWYM